MLPRRELRGIPYTATCAGGYGPPNHRGQPAAGADPDSIALADSDLSFSGAATPQILASLEMLGMARVYTVILMIGTNDVFRGETRKVMKLHDKLSCILEELRIQMDPAILTVCAIPYNMKAEQHSMEMNTKVRNLNEVVRQIHQKSVLTIGQLNVAEQMERSFPNDASSDGIHFDRPRGV